MRPPLFVPDPSAADASGSGEAGDEKVGYGRPPRATRFLPGQSGNPRGRPNRARILGALLARALDQTVEAKESSGRRRTITKLEAAVTQLVNRAASGDQRATLLVFSMLHDDASRSKPPALERDRESDDLVVAEIIRRLSQPQE